MNESIQNIEQQLDELSKKVSENYQEQSRLGKEAGELKNQEMSLRSRLLFEKKILCAKPWSYNSKSRLCGRYDNYPGLGKALGRFVDYHAYVQLEENVQLCLCDSDIYIDFDLPSVRNKENIKSNISSFIQRWGIQLKTDDLQEKRKRTLEQLAEVDQMLDTIKGLQNG